MHLLNKLFANKIQICRSVNIFLCIVYIFSYKSFGGRAQSFSRKVIHHLTVHWRSKK
jgi:hypothetical protein